MHIRLLANLYYHKKSVNQANKHSDMPKKENKHS